MSRAAKPRGVVSAATPNALYHRARYDELKAHGLCVHCKQDRDRPGAYCSKCTKNYGPSKDAACAAWRKRAERKGKCLHCGKRDVNETWEGRRKRLCGICEEKERASQRNRYRAAHPEVKKRLKCGLCRQPGHNRFTCMGLSEAAPLSIDELAAARRGD